LNYQRAAAVEEPVAQVLDEELLQRERVLKTSILQIDDLTGGFRSSQVTLLDSDSSYATNLLYLLCIRAVSQFDEEVVWIDGGNDIDPYAIGSLCKRLRLDKRDILSRMNVSRAFTAYQLVTLIDEKLEEQVEQSAPSAIIVSSVADMFLDKDMKWMESHQLLRRCLEDVSRVTKEHETISVITGHALHKAGTGPMLSTLLYEHADLAIQMRVRKNGLLFRIPRADREMIFLPVPWNQLTLDEFRGEEHGTDCAHISLGA
jgi:predicted ATP-dependent serine protease